MKKKTKKKCFADISPPCVLTAAGVGTEEINNHLSAILETDLSEVVSATDVLRNLSASDVSDGIAFKCIRQDPRVLGFRFMQEKIAEWQDKLHGSDGWEAIRAEKNLRRIGIELASKRSDSKGHILALANIKDFLFVQVSRFTEKQVRELLAGIEDALKEHGDRVKLLDDTEIAPLLVDIELNRIHHVRLANLITAKMAGYTESTLKQKLKTVTEIVLPDGSKGYAVE